MMIIISVVVFRARAMLMSVFFLDTAADIIAKQ